MDCAVLDNCEGESIKESNVVDLKNCKTLDDVERSLINCSSKPRLRYTKDELLKIKEYPLSLKAPTLNNNLKFLIEKFALKSENKDEFEIKKSALKKPGIVRVFDKSDDKGDLVKKVEITRSEKLTVTFRTDKLEDNKKATDPASRIRKEPEICLSPQRKSFNSGCSVQNAKVEAQGGPEITANPTININPKQNGQKDSILSSVGGLSRENRGDIRDRDHRNDSRDSRNDTRDNRNDMRDNRNDAREVRPRDLPPRRIGSGRIISSDPSMVIRGYPENRMMAREKPPQVVFKCTFQKSVDGDRDSREYRDSRDSVWDRQRSVMSQDRRKFSDHHYDNDSREQQQRVTNFFERRKHYTNDYHRYHEEDNEPEWMKDGPDSKHDFIELRGFDEHEMKSFGRSGSHNNSHSVTASKEKSSTPDDEADKDRVTPVDKENTSNETNTAVEDGESKKDADKNLKSHDGPSIELNLDEIFKTPLPEMISDDKVENTGSRFTRWFKRDNESSTSIDNVGNQMPANLTDNENHKAIEHELIQRSGNGVASNKNIMDLFKGNQEKQTAASAKMDVRVLEASGKLHSLEEIEAKLRGMDANKSNPLNPDRKKKEEESEAFKKLLSQAFQTNSGSGSVQKFMDNNPAIMNESFMQKMRLDSQILPQGKPNFPSALCNGDSFMNLPNQVTPAQLSKIQSIQHQMQLQQQQQQQQQQQMHHQQQSTDMLRLLQQQRQNKSQQEMLSRMLVPGGNFNANVPTSFNRPPPAEGPYAHISQEIQTWVNSYQMSMDVIKRQETKNLLAAIRHGELTVYHLIEQLKKTAPYQARFSDSALCILKYLQLHEPQLANCSPTSMSFAVPPPQSSSAVPSSALQHVSPQSSHFGENMIHQMIMNQQMRSAIPDIVYQRDFSAHNQNAFPNNVVNAGKKFPAPQVNSSPIINVSHSNLPNSPSNMNAQPGREDKVTTPSAASVNSPSNSAMPKSLSFTPTSVLLKLSAEKENLDYSASKESNELKPVDDSGKLPGINNAPVKNLFMNGIMGNQDQLSRIFTSDNQSRLLSSNSGPSAPVQNMMSLEEIERVQQSVRN